MINAPQWNERLFNDPFSEAAPRAEDVSSFIGGTALEFVDPTEIVAQQPADQPEKITNPVTLLRQISDAHQLNYQTEVIYRALDGSAYGVSATMQIGGQEYFWTFLAESTTKAHRDIARKIVKELNLTSNNLEVEPLPPTALEPLHSLESLSEYTSQLHLPAAVFSFETEGHMQVCTVTFEDTDGSQHSFTAQAASKKAAKRAAADSLVTQLAHIRN